MSEVKVMFIVLALAFLAAFGMEFHERGVKIDTLNQKTGAQTQVIADQSKTIKVDKASNAVTDAVTAGVVQQAQHVDAVLDKHDAALKKTESAINAKYTKLIADERVKDPTPAAAPTKEQQLLDQRSDELSQARMDDLRSFLCDVDKTSTSCPTQPGAST
jgi:hypothetical protein